MQFQITPDVIEHFPPAITAYIRSRAHVAQTPEESRQWHTLWTTFRDADNATLDVPDDCARRMFYVWATPRVWRDERTRHTVRDTLRPQWRRQMLGH